MVQFTGQDAMPASVARQKDDFAPAQLAGEKSSEGAPKGVLSLTHFWRVNRRCDKVRCRL